MTCSAKELHSQTIYGLLSKEVECPMQLVAVETSFDRHIWWCKKCGALLTEVYPEGTGRGKMRLFDVQVPSQGDSSEG